MPNHDQPIDPEEFEVAHRAFVDDTQQSEDASDQNELELLQYEEEVRRGLQAYDIDLTSQDYFDEVRMAIYMEFGDMVMGISESDPPKASALIFVNYADSNILAWLLSENSDDDTRPEHAGRNKVDDYSDGCTDDYQDAAGEYVQDIAAVLQQASYEHNRSVQTERKKEICAEILADPTMYDKEKWVAYINHTLPGEDFAIDDPASPDWNLVEQSRPDSPEEIKAAEQKAKGKIEGDIQRAQIKEYLVARNIRTEDPENFSRMVGEIVVGFRICHVDPGQKNAYAVGNAMVESALKRLGLGKHERDEITMLLYPNG